MLIKLSEYEIHLSKTKEEKKRERMLSLILHCPTLLVSCVKNTKRFQKNNPLLHVRPQVPFWCRGLIWNGDRSQFHCQNFVSSFSLTFCWLELQPGDEASRLKRSGDSQRRRKEKETKKKKLEEGEWGSCRERREWWELSEWDKYYWVVPFLFLNFFSQKPQLYLILV